MEERETIDGYTLEGAYWSGNLFDVEDELLEQVLLEYTPKVWKEYGDTMEESLEILDRSTGGML